ncbi:hypothetical protein Emag_006633 [Eimeria magna]
MDDSICSRFSDALLREQARKWLASDRNMETLDEARRLLESAPEDKLKDLFCRYLVFGTAGLRAQMGAGFSRLNDVTIQQTSQGFSVYLANRHGQDACRQRGIVIGRDVRHNSERFSHLTAAVFLNRGFKVFLFRAPVHTPLIPFAVRKLNCVAGVMITASHNPKEYNGYKVYDDNGVQIIPPVDVEIADAIRANETLWDDVELLFDRVEGRCHPHTEEEGELLNGQEDVVEEYMSAVSADLCSRRELTAKSDLKIVYTPMHGVGLPFVTELLKRFGFSKGLIPGKRKRSTAYPSGCWQLVLARPADHVLNYSHSDLMSTRPLRSTATLPALVLLAIEDYHRNLLLLFFSRHTVGFRLLRARLPSP